MFFYHFLALYESTESYFYNPDSVGVDHTLKFCVKRFFLCDGQGIIRGATLSDNRSCSKGNNFCKFLFVSVDDSALPEWVYS